MPQFAEGEIFARYRIEGLLGQGGMGEVYRAYDVLLRRHIALKVVRPSDAMAVDEADSKEAAARTLREARAAAALSHRSAVAIFDVGEVQGTPFIAMELVLGRTLRTYIGDPDVATDQKLRWLVDIALVLGAAHEAGLIHRDIKPENVMVCTDRAIKVLDFGIARRTEPAGPPSSAHAPRSDGLGLPPSFRTAEGRLRGTPRYMAPEQLDGARLDGRSDQYAWGVVAYELLSGSRPAAQWEEGQTDPRWAPPPKLLHELTPGVPFAVGAAIDKALARLPELRHAGMDAVAAALEPFAAPVGGASAPAGRLSAPSSPSSAGATTDPTVRMPLVGPDDPTAEDPRSPPVRAPRRAMRAGWIVALSFLAFSVAAATLWRGSARRARDRSEAVASASAPTLAALPAPVGPPLVLILGFENRTTDPVFDGTLELILESSLKRSTRVYPLAGAGVRAMAAELAPKANPSDEQLGRLVAEHTGRPIATVRGTVAPDGSGYQLTFQAKDGRSDTEIAASSLKAETTDKVLPTVARFASVIRTALGDPPPPEDLEKAGMSTSIEADHEFAAGRGAAATGKPALAMSHLQRAIEIDPGFIAAQGALGTALLNAGRESEAEVHLRASIADTDVISEREHLMFLGAYHFSRDEFDSCIAAFEGLISKWPGETRVFGNLAYSYYAKGAFARAHELAVLAVLERPSSVIARSNLIGVELVTGDFEKTAEEARTALTVSAHPLAQVYAYGALAAAMLGKRDDALDFHRRLREADAPAATAIEADFAAFEGRLADAAALLEAGISADLGQKTKEAAESKWATLAEVRLRQGGAAGAARDAASHAAASAEVITLYRAARVLLVAGRPKEAAAIAERISKRPGDRARLASRLLEAVSLRANGSGRRAVDALAAAGDAWIVHAELGETYLGLSAFEDAERELAICFARRGEGLTAFLDDTVTARYLPPVLYDLARAKDRLHRPDATDADSH